MELADIIQYNFSFFMPRSNVPYISYFHQLNGTYVMFSYLRRPNKRTKWIDPDRFQDDLCWARLDTYATHLHLFQIDDSHKKFIKNNA